MLDNYRSLNTFFCIFLLSWGSLNAMEPCLHLFQPSVQKGYLEKVLALDPKTEHTIADLHAYLSDNLGSDFLTIIHQENYPVKIVIGENTEAMALLKLKNISILKELVKKDGFYQVYLAQDEQGQKIVVINRVNGNDRIYHVQSLLRLAQLPSNRLETMGKTHSWKNAYLNSFRPLPRPDKVIVGFSNTISSQIMKFNVLENKNFYSTLTQLYDQKHAPTSMSEHDLARLPLQIIEFENGKKIWLIQNTYGDLALDLFSALEELEIKDLTYIGTAGALDGEKLGVGDLFIPKAILDENGQEISLKRFNKHSIGVKISGLHTHVSSPNIETKEWLTKSLNQGLQTVEVELPYIVQARKNPTYQTEIVLVVSDVLQGPGAQDMTVWGVNHSRSLQSKLQPLLDQWLGLSSAHDYKIRDYQLVYIEGK